VEPIVRLPFLLLHLLGLFAFWWALRQGSGPRVALLGLAILAVLPVSALYATLVNYENPSIVWILFGYGFHARFLRHARRADLVGLALCFALACSVTFAPLFFVPPLLLQALARRRLRAAVVETFVIGGAVALPILVHGALVRSAGAASDSLPARAQRLLGPLFDGSAPLGEWLGKQAARMEFFFSAPIFYVACAGLLVALWRSWSQRGERAAERVHLDLPLALGGLGTLLAFYRHTFDGQGVTDGQTVFLLNVAPAAAALVATSLDALAAPLYRLRAGLLPLVVLTSMVGMPGVARTNQLRERWRAPGPRDDPALVEGPDQPLPSTVGAEIHELLPAGCIGMYPQGVGFNLAVGYYAWRTLVPVTDETWGFQMIRLRDAGLAERTRYILLPREPRAAMAATVASVRERLEQRFSLVASSERWELWPAFAE
jgi:hypothetical protein